MDTADLRSVQAAYNNLVDADPSGRDQRPAEWRETVRGLPAADGWRTTVVLLSDGSLNIAHAHLTAADFDPGLPYVLCGADVESTAMNEDHEDESFTGWSALGGVVICATCAAYDPFSA